MQVVTRYTFRKVVTVLIIGLGLYFVIPWPDDPPSWSEIAEFGREIRTRFPIGSSGDDKVRTLEVSGYQPLSTLAGQNEAFSHQTVRHFAMGKLSGRHYSWENYCKEPGKWVVTWTQDSEGRITELDAYHGVAFCM